MMGLLIIGYLVGSAASFWAMCDHYLRLFRRVTLGDAIFFAGLAITPAWLILLPLALCCDRKWHGGKEIVLWERK